MSQTPEGSEEAVPNAIDVPIPRSQRPTGILFTVFGTMSLLLGIAGVFLLRQWAVLFMAFGLAFLVVGVRKIRTPGPQPQ